MTNVSEYGRHECIPTQDAYDATVRALEKHRERANRAEKELEELRTKAAAMAEEYRREPRRLLSLAVADMLDEWNSR